ncbi:hypothetical protein J4573_46175 [Actinomadura barringtoniae]|uniref:Laminin G domain-containing protein n=1 Tax=Actinomadura barringtoniae TaxID=1427535 RepID=A0A939PQY3_9ACTN|nr:LamG-like jellyroll fold domain-containing protein [Actinomadura barringtoniae]MBO2454544.1 hypothetical protein [Actinomadura barringtoniae]
MSWYERQHRKVHGPGQLWGSAGNEHEQAVGGNRNHQEPKTLSARHPITPVKRPKQPTQNPVRVASAPTTEPKSTGFDPAKSRELSDRRAAYTRTFANGDGTETTEFSAQPVNYQRADGTWVPIDNRVVPVGKTALAAPPSGGWRNAAGAADVRLAPRTGSGSLVRLTLDGAHQIAYGTQDGVASTGQAGERAVSYPDVWTDADLKLDVASAGVKETIVLRSTKAPRTFVFPLSLKGLAPKLVNGQVVFVDETGTTRATVPAGFMTDSANTPATSTKVSYSLVSLGGAPALQVSVDSAWLTDPARKFPVMVDPTVKMDKADSSVSINDGGTTDGGQTLSIGSRSAAYLTFPQLVSQLKFHKIYGAYLWMYDYEAVTCHARPVTVHPVTEAWAGKTGLTFPGPSVGKALTRKSFSHGYVEFGAGSSKCPPKKGELFDLGKGGRDLVQKWANDPSQNFGLSVRDASGGSSGTKKFAGHDTANPPRLYVTHTPYNASYAITSPVPNPPVTQAQSGKIKISVTNTGADTWTPSGYYLAYRAYNDKGKLVTQQRSANLTANVAHGAKVNLDATIKPLPVGTFSLDFTMVKSGGPVFTDEYVPPIRLIIKIINLAPVLQEVYPFNGYQTPTLSPQMWAKAVDLDATPNSSLSYKFEICEQGPGGSAVNCFDSGYLPTFAWTVPAGKLSWSKTYLWRAFAKDATSETPSPRVMMQTSVPQPEVTSRLAEAQDREFDPMSGNYSTTAVDASVASAGPSLTVERTYNSLDPRRDSPFGAGWSTQFDMRTVEDQDGTGNVVVSYPDGQQVRFGKNADGTFASPQGRQATFTLNGAAGKLTDKSGNSFEFTGGRLTKISDRGGHSIVLYYDTSTGRLSTATGLGGRVLNFGWTGAHVTSVSTAPVDGKVLTWNYTYDGDKLMKACAPGGRCTSYDYDTGSHYRSVVLDTRPESYWRLGEDDGGSATSQVSVNLGKDAGTYKDTTLGTPGAIAGTDNTAATFNGSSSQVAIPPGTVKKSRDIAVEVWFKNQPSGPGGPLLGYQDKPLNGTPSIGVPVLYTGTDGKLHGQFYTGSVTTPITSSAFVNDAKWHHAVLSATGSTQTLYLDGAVAGTLSNATPNHPTLTYNQIGAAYATNLGSGTSWGSTPKRSYAGSIDEVAIYQHPLDKNQVAAHYREALRASDQISKITLPSGKTATEVSYDTDNDRVSEYTDQNGGTWKITLPVVYGNDTATHDNVEIPDPDVRRAVEVHDPADRYYLYEQDAVTDQLIRVGVPMGQDVRDEDNGWPETDTPSPTPTRTCSSPDPDDPTFCTDLPPGGGDEPDFIHHSLDGMGIRTFDYDDRGFLSAVTNENGDTVKLVYDDRGNLTARTTCRSKDVCNTAYYSYPAVTSLTDPRNDLPIAYQDGRSSGPTDDRYKTSYAYVANGSLQVQTNPSGGGQVNYTFTNGTESAVGGGTMPAYMVSTMTDPRGAVTRYGYTSAGDVGQVTSPSGMVTKYTYDAIGRRKTETEVSDSVPAGATTSYGYDDWSNLTSVTAPTTTNAVTGVQQQQRIDTTFDVDGNVLKTQVVDKLANGDPRVTSYDYDDQNHVEKVTDSYGHEAGFDYDRFGNVTEMVDAGDNHYGFAYTARNKLAQVRLYDFDGDPDGVSSPGDFLVLRAYSYDAAGRLASTTDAMGHRTDYAYYGDDLLKSATLKKFHNTDGSIRDVVLASLEYDGAGHPTKQVIGNGLNAVQNTYDYVGRVDTTTVDPGKLNRRATFTYDLGGNVTQVARTGVASNLPWLTSTAAETTNYGYDPVGRLAKQTVTDGTTSLVTTYGYDQRDLLTSRTDPRGNVAGADKTAYTTNYAYDELGRSTKTTSPQVSVESNGGQPAAARPETVTGYNAFDENTEDKDELGNISRVEYDNLGQPVKWVDPIYTPPGSSAPLTPTTIAHYDPLGRMSSLVDPRQDETRYTYDRLGRLQVKDTPNKTNDDRVQWNYDYTRTGQMLSSVDPNGARTEATYDDLGRQITSTEIERRPTPASYTTRYGYDDAGNQTKTIAPSGATSAAVYDTTNALIRTIDPANVTSELGYDGQGRQVRTSDGLSRTTKLTYNLLGQLSTRADLKPDGGQLRSSSYTYDRADNVTSITDPLKHKQTFDYDGLNRLVKQVEPTADTASITTTFGYDAASNRTRFTDGRKNSTVYTVNSLGLPESTIDPSTAAQPNVADRTFTTSYDEVGNPVKLTEPGGIVRQRTFDANQRMRTETGTGTSKPTPDRVLAYDAVGQLTKANAGSGTNVFGYNDRGELLNADGPSGKASWDYNGDDQPVTRTDSAGTATFGYANGRLDTVRDAITGTTQTLGYNNAGQPYQVDYGSGRVRTIGYDDLGRPKSDTLKNSSDAVVTSTTYGYDDNDQTTSKTTTGVAGAGDNTYGYDYAGRLISWKQNGNTTNYEWDDSGNRTKSGDTTATYDERNRQLTDGTTSSTYTPRGTLASKTVGSATNSYDFDAFDRLTTAGNTSYTYDSLDRLATRNGTVFAYNGTSDEPTTDGASTYSRGPSGELLSTSQGSNKRISLLDKHGDLTGQFDPATTLSTLTDSTSYSPFGQPTATTGVKPTVGYQSDWTDPDSGQVNMGARWYNPSTAGFPNRDDWTLSPSPASINANRYTYGNANPLDNADPTGHSPVGGDDCRHDQTSYTAMGDCAPDPKGPKGPGGCPGEGRDGNSPPYNLYSVSALMSGGCGGGSGGGGGGGGSGRNRGGGGGGGDGLSPGERARREKERKRKRTDAAKKRQERKAQKSPVAPPSAAKTPHYPDPRDKFPSGPRKPAPITQGTKNVVNDTQQSLRDMRNNAVNTAGPVVGQISLPSQSAPEISPATNVSCAASACVGGGDDDNPGIGLPWPFPYPPGDALKGLGTDIGNVLKDIGDSLGSIVTSSVTAIAIGIALASGGGSDADDNDGHPGAKSNDPRVTRDPILVDTEDELFDIANKEAGGSLDNLVERKDHFWIGRLSDGSEVEIEWNPKGHDPKDGSIDEGPHVKVAVRRDPSDPRSRWLVVRKYFIRGRPTWSRRHG